MPVAKVPGDLDQMSRVLGGNLHQILGLRQNLDDPAILKFQTVAVVQMNGGRFVQQKGETACSGHDRTPAIPVLTVQGDAVGRLALQIFGPLARRVNFPNADHADSATLAIIAMKAGRSLRCLK